MALGVRVGDLGEQRGVGGVAVLLALDLGPADAGRVLVEVESRRRCVSTPSTRVSGAGAFGGLEVAYIRNGPNGKSSSVPQTVPASSSTRPSAVAPSRAVRPRVVKVSIGS